MAQWAQLLPYRCSHYSSSLRQFAAHQTQPCWWCSPFLQVQPDISQESLPATQFPWLCPALPWSMIQLWSTNPLLQTGAESIGVQAKASREKRDLKEWIYAHREESSWNSASMCAFRNTSVSRWDTVSERVNEQAENEGWRGGCCVSSAAASTNAELRCNEGLHVHLPHLPSHFLTRLSATTFISKLFPICILFICTFA